MGTVDGDLACFAITIIVVIIWTQEPIDILS